MIRIDLHRTLCCMITCCLLPLSSYGAPSETLAVAPGLSGEIKVTRLMVERHMKRSPDQTLEAAIQELVDTALLVQIARSRGLDSDPFVQERKREALAWTYLKTIFEPTHLAQAVSDSDAQGVYQSNLSRFVHPEVVKADHIVLGMSTEKSLEMPKNADVSAKAKQILVSLAERLQVSPPSSEAVFLEAAKPIQPEVETLGLTVRGESLGWFALEDGPFDRGFDSVFRKRAFPVEVGRLSEVFASPFGWHLVRVSKRRSAKNESYDDAKAAVKERMLNEVRKRELEQLSAALAQQYPALSDRAGLLRLLRIEPLIRLDSKRSLPKLEQ